MLDVLIWNKYSRIIKLLSQQLGVSEERALGIFYRSRVYKVLSDKDSLLITQPDRYIAEEVILAMRG